MVAAAPRPRLEVADILRAHGAEYRARHPVSPEQAAVMRHLVACRTAALRAPSDTAVHLLSANQLMPRSPRIKTP